MLYLHIPFCKQKCSYCNFHFSTSLNFKDEMVDAICREIEMRHYELPDRHLRSIYFGGGTPSVLEYKDLAKIVDRISKHFTWNLDTEITLEANPDDLTASFIKSLMEIGINRLSIGIQSFFDEDLKLMNRAHNSSAAESAVLRSQDSGLTNISIDLIYGSPSGSFAIWKENLKKTIELHVCHVSAYALTVEPKTALQSWIAAKKITPPDENIQSEEFLYMSNFLRESGYDHYEISNFGLPGFHSRHNSAYWQGNAYLGVGPSAHSYSGSDRRSWNIANNAQYIKSIHENKLPSEYEILSESDRYNEMIMIGLRTSRGVNINHIKSLLSAEIYKKCKPEIERKLQNSDLVLEDDFLKIPYENWFMADGIAASLFLV